MDIARSDEWWLFDQTASMEAAFSNLSDIIAITSWIGILFAAACVTYVKCHHKMCTPTHVSGYQPDLCPHPQTCLPRARGCGGNPPC